jgi:molybdate transport system substrate-binding protein
MSRWVEGRVVRLQPWTDKLYSIQVEAEIARFVAGQFTRLAMANPELAPYGLAALDTLRSLDLDRGVAGKLVFGDNVGQAFAMLHTGNVDLAFVAAAQVIAEGIAEEMFWRVPEELHTPIRQQLVLLGRAAENPAALEFLEYLDTPAAQALIVGLGYRPLRELPSD